MRNIVYCRKNNGYGWFLSDIRDWKRYRELINSGVAPTAKYLLAGNDAITRGFDAGKGYWRTEAEAIAAAEAVGLIVMPRPEGDLVDISYN